MLLRRQVRPDEIDRDDILHPSQATSLWPPTVAAVRRRHDGRRVLLASSRRITGTSRF